MVAGRTEPLRAVRTDSCGAGLLREPSALDLASDAPSLLVAKLPGGDLAIAWEDVGADSYRLHQGLTASGAWSATAAVICDLPLPQATIRADAPAAFFVASAVVAGAESSLGRDSFGWDRGGRADCR